MPPDHDIQPPSAGEEITVQPATADDLPFLWDMLFEAAAVSPAMRALGKETTLAQPANQKYLTAWGRPGDTAVVAFDTTELPLGAAWYRLFPESAPGYGFVASDIPELSIGVGASARGQGVGTFLLQVLLAMARTQRFERISLSVDRRNRARALYERLGFRDAGVSDPDDSSITLVALL